MPLRISMRSRPRGRLFVISCTSITTLRSVFCICSVSSITAVFICFCLFHHMGRNKLGPYSHLIRYISNCLKHKRAAHFCDASGDVFSTGLWTGNAAYLFQLPALWSLVYNIAYSTTFTLFFGALASTFGQQQ